MRWKSSSLTCKSNEIGFNFRKGSVAVFASSNLGLCASLTIDFAAVGGGARDSGVACDGILHGGPKGPRSTR
jgi:hypothetical protein